MGLATAVGGAALEANWNKSIRIEDLVKLTNVGTRSLFRSFRKTRGYSPMAFAKLLRLNHAKEMLSNGGSNTSVTRHLGQHHVTRMTLDQGRDVAVVRPGQQIAFPMARHRPIFNRGRSLTD